MIAVCFSLVSEKLPPKHGWIHMLTYEPFARRKERNLNYRETSGVVAFLTTDSA
jgi:hypothetical protein